MFNVRRDWGQGITWCGVACDERFGGEPDLLRANHWFGGEAAKSHKPMSASEEKLICYEQIIGLGERLRRANRGASPGERGV